MTLRGGCLRRFLTLNDMHSGLILLLWLAAVASIQILPPAALGPAVLSCTVAALLFARVRGLRLLRRIRVLLLAIVVLFAWFTPGEALLLDWPRLGPSREGSVLALVHGARLVAVVCAVALLLEHLPLARLIGGLYALSRPLRLIGVPPERLALRLLLVLRYVDTSPRGHKPMHWKEWLEDEATGSDNPAVLLQRERLSRTDAVVALGVFAMLFWWSLG